MLREFGVKGVKVQEIVSLEEEMMAFLKYDPGLKNNSGRIYGFYLKPVSLIKRGIVNRSMD